MIKSNTEIDTNPLTPMQEQPLHMLPVHRQRELAFMKRLSKRHLSNWPSKKTFPRFKF